MKDICKIQLQKKKVGKMDAEKVPLKGGGESMPYGKSHEKFPYFHFDYLPYSSRREKNSFFSTTIFM